MTPLFEDLPMGSSHIRNLCKVNNFSFKLCLVYITLDHIALHLVHTCIQIKLDQLAVFPLLLPRPGLPLPRWCLPAPLTENTVGKCPLTHWTINSNFTATLQMLITKHTILKSYPSKRTEKSRRLTHCQCQLWNPLWLGKCESVKVKAANCAKVLKTFSHTAHVAQFIPPERTAIVLLLMKFVAYCCQGQISFPVRGNLGKDHQLVTFTSLPSHI